MKKIINTFKYGDKKVKRSLALAILAGVFTAFFGVLALVMSNMLCFFIAIMAAFITITLIQTFMIAEGENPTVVGGNKSDVNESDANEGINSETRKAKNINNSKKKRKQNIDNEYQNSDSNKQEKVEKEKDKKEKVKKEKDKKEKVKKEKVKKEKAKKDKANYDNNYNNDDNYDNDEEDVNINTARMDQPEVEDDISELEDTPSKKNKFKVITADTAATYTKKKIKKTLHKYKVIKDHRMVMVDQCDRLHIYQTPAYVWIQDNQFHILLIEEEPRLIMVPLFRITEISYLKKQPAAPDKDYSIFNKNTILTECFRPYLPDYNQSNKTNDLTSYKNLYGITQGIYFTNNSAKNLFDLLGVDFYVEDKVTTSNKVNLFFKDAYKANIKLRDNVLDANGYADSITRILDDMAHSNISYAEFKDTLNLMTKNKLITDEYANHYMDVRNSLRG